MKLNLKLKKRAGNKKRPFHFAWFVLDFIEALTMVFMGLAIAFILGAIIYGLTYVFLINILANNI